MADKLLIVDDEEAILKQLDWAFRKDYDISTASDVETAIESVKNVKPSLMILDLSLSGDPDDLEGFHILGSALKLDPKLKVIVITGHDDRENALRALELGAVDFYSKPVDMEELRVILQRAAYIHSLESEISRLRKRPREGHEFEGIIAMCEEMLGVFETVKKVSPTGVSILITGESGTGKELIARAVHNRSPRSDKPFVAINCGAIPENLLESELFGHEKGSFTGAHSSRPGKFEVADGGTLFLDEIGELPPSLQVKILRFLQDQVIERVGGHEKIQVDVRIIAATNRELSSMIEEKKFREDLYYRINTITIGLPPLRERGDDIYLLAMRFLHHYGGEFARNVRNFSQSAREAIYAHSWPGNVRELENRVKRAVIMAAGNIIQPSDLDLAPAGREAGGRSGAIAPYASLDQLTLKEARDELERQLITSSLLRNSGNVSAAAQQLEVSRPTLHDMMKKHGIDPEDFRASRKKK